MMFWPTLALSSGLRATMVIMLLVMVAVSFGQGGRASATPAPAADAAREFVINLRTPAKPCQKAVMPGYGQHLPECKLRVQRHSKHAGGRSGAGPCPNRAICSRGLGLRPAMHRHLSLSTSMPPRLMRA